MMIAIEETFNVLPPEAKREVMNLLERLAQKYLKKKASPPPPDPKEILTFAGSWKDMEETEFQALIDNVYERRKQTSTRRRDI